MITNGKFFIIRFAEQIKGGGGMHKKTNAYFFNSAKTPLFTTFSGVLPFE